MTMRPNSFQRLSQELIAEEVLPAVARIANDDPKSLVLFTNMCEAVEDRATMWLQQQPVSFNLKSQLPKPLHGHPPSEAVLLYLLDIAVKGLAQKDSKKLTVLQAKINALSARAITVLDQPTQAALLIEALMDKSRGASR
jgi:hypothetical protein